MEASLAHLDSYCDELVFADWIDAVEK